MIHWSRYREQGSVLGIKLLLKTYTLFGRTPFRLLLRIVMVYYWLIARNARHASKNYLARLRHYAATIGQPLPDNLSSYRHFLSFGETMLDKLAAWQGDFDQQHLSIFGSEPIMDLLEQGRGGVLIGSHLGNIELCRALSRQFTDVKINALVFSEHAERFNRVMQKINPQAAVNLIAVSSIGPTTAMALQQKIAQGEWVVIVADRTSTTQESRHVMADFLGSPAPFPQGPFILASILKAPVFLLFGLRDESQASTHFNVYFEPFDDPILLPRKNREAALQQVAQRYAQRVEFHTLSAALQWYNFFDFWQLTEKNDVTTS